MEKLISLSTHLSALITKMSNTYFQFKQFRIHQDMCAMKVCTDACIFGAYIEASEAKNILDIGTGTGLLSLMIAQKSEGIIDAVEIEENAYTQAKENFEPSVWSKRLNIFHQSIQEFSKNADRYYDLIVSNPPFFTDNLKSSQSNRNIALHNESLSFHELAAAVKTLLSKDGSFYILLPEYEFDLFKEEASKSGLYLNEICTVKDKTDAAVLRLIGRYSFTSSALEKSEIIIKDNSGAYSEGFKNLLKEYYLNL
ncbi:MAG: methyltransferase [Cytophagaceae bacterium]|nr:methyltransferase [Cytophagaceae bacterium]